MSKRVWLKKREIYIYILLYVNYILLCKDRTENKKMRKKIKDTHKINLGFMINRRLLKREYRANKSIYITIIYIYIILY